MSFSIKLQEINLNVCEEYKTKREARGANRMERDDHESRALVALKFVSDVIVSAN